MKSTAEESSKNPPNEVTTTELPTVKQVNFVLFTVFIVLGSVVGSTGVGLFIANYMSKVSSLTVGDPISILFAIGLIITGCFFILMAKLNDN